jgi:HD-GYP domain-containing protein (c-di-GMP phosphodiesterase class II)
MAEDPAQSGSGEFLALDVATLRRDVETRFALHLRTPDGKFVLYRGTNTRITSEIFENLLQNRVSQLWIASADRAGYEEYVAEHLAAMVDDASVPVESKCRAAFSAASGAMKHVFDGDASPTVITATTEKIVGPMAKIMIGERGAATHLVALTTTDYALYAKAVNVSILGMLLVQKILDIDDPKRLLEIGAGFLLFDLAKKNWPKELRERPGPLTPEEWEIVKRHPREALEMLKGFPLSLEAKLIISQHHERADGRGYPHGIRGTEIHPFATIAALADSFVAMTSDRPFARRLTTFQALHRLRAEMRGRVDPDVFGNFVTLFAKDPAAPGPSATS